MITLQNKWDRVSTAAANYNPHDRAADKLQHCMGGSSPRVRAQCSSKYKHCRHDVSNFMPVPAKKTLLQRILTLPLSLCRVKVLILYWTNKPIIMEVSNQGAAPLLAGAKSRPAGPIPPPPGGAQYQPRSCCTQRELDEQRTTSAHTHKLAAEFLFPSHAMRSLNNENCATLIRNWI